MAGRPGHSTQVPCNPLVLPLSSPGPAPAPLVSFPCHLWQCRSSAQKGGILTLTLSSAQLSLAHPVLQCCVYHQNQKTHLNPPFQVQERRTGQRMWQPKPRYTTRKDQRPLELQYHLKSVAIGPTATATNCTWGQLHLRPTATGTNCSNDQLQLQPTATATNCNCDQLQL